MIIRLIPDSILICDIGIVITTLHLRRISHHASALASPARPIYNLVLFILLRRLHPGLRNIPLIFKFAIFISLALSLFISILFSSKSTLFAFFHLFYLLLFFCFQLNDFFSRLFSCDLASSQDPGSAGQGFGVTRWWLLSHSLCCSQDRVVPLCFVEASDVTILVRASSIVWLAVVVVCL